MFWDLFIPYHVRNDGHSTLSCTTATAYSLVCIIYSIIDCIFQFFNFILHKQDSLPSLTMPACLYCVSLWLHGRLYSNDSHIIFILPLSCLLAKTLHSLSHHWPWTHGGCHIRMDALAMAVLSSSPHCLGNSSSEIRAASPPPKVPEWEHMHRGPELTSSPHAGEQRKRCFLLSHAYILGLFKTSWWLRL